MTHRGASSGTKDLALLVLRNVCLLPWSQTYRGRIGNGQGDFIWHPTQSKSARKQVLITRTYAEKYELSMDETSFASLSLSLGWKGFLYESETWHRVGTVTELSGGGTPPPYFFLNPRYLKCTTISSQDGGGLGTCISSFNFIDCKICPVKTQQSFQGCVATVPECRKKVFFLIIKFRQC